MCILEFLAAVFSGRDLAVPLFPGGRSVLTGGAADGDEGAPVGAGYLVWVGAGCVP